jgi:hypothetical protein
MMMIPVNYSMHWRTQEFLHGCRMHDVDPFDFEYEVNPEPEMAGHKATS